MGDNSLVNLGELSKPATTLVEKVSDLVGGICKPWQIERVARAEAKADVIRANARVEVTDIERRAALRFIKEEAHKQQNIEQIVQRALPMLDEGARPEDIDDDWLVNYFDKCRIISNADMQRLWAAILARAANIPGSFSRRAVNILGDMDSYDANLFKNVCSFCISCGDIIPIVYRSDDDIYRNNGISFFVLQHLDSIGLINFDISGRQGYKIVDDVENVVYFDNTIELKFCKEHGYRFDAGKVVLTQAGFELQAICGAAKVEGFIEYLCSRWSELGYSFVLQASGK